MENYIEIHVLEGDQISGWVEETGHLDHDQNFLPKILEHIKAGDTVVDAGAFIGDHTIAYATRAGRRGKVLAFEPNEKAAECLRHNLELYNLDNVKVYHRALDEKKGGSLLAAITGTGAESMLANTCR